MIGIVIVSHSARLAEGVCELAGQLAQGRVPMAAAGGIDDPDHPIGTDAFKVLAAIEAVYGAGGVLVLMDLGSALLSAETALEFLDEERRAGVRLCAAPLVEGALAAVGAALTGGDLDAAAREALGALQAKAAQLGAPGPGAPASPPASSTPLAAPPAPQATQRSEARATLRNPLGLHARPAAQLVREAAQHTAHLTVRNLTAGRGPTDATSINGILSLGARSGHELAIAGEGPGASEAVAALAALVAAGFGEAEGASPAMPAPPAMPGPAPDGTLTGLPASPGVALGPLLRLPPAAAHGAQQAADPVAERRRLDEALAAAAGETQALVAWARERLGVSAAAIFDAQLLFLADPTLAAAARQHIAAGAAAGAAWQAAVDAAAQGLRAVDDPYLQARAADIADVGRRVLTHLLGPGTAPAALSTPGILAAHDLAPSQIRELDPERVLGICLEAGSPGSHAAILARALGIPVVAGLGPALAALAEGTPVALDGERGLLWVAPAGVQAELVARRSAWLARRQALAGAVQRPAITREGHRVRLLANIAGLSDVAPALACGAEGVGVLRTEFLFRDRSEPPAEEEQRAAYRAIAEALGPRPLVIRTLDAGGDKPLPFVDIGPEANPFLGRRGIRAGLAQPGLLKTQLRAVLRAGVGKELHIMFPMIASPEELRAARAVLDEARAELERTGMPAAALQVGIMIEVPAAAALASRLAAEVDFFSIGTNDLSQYVMAADRTNPRVAALADPLHPAVLHTVARAVRAAQAAGIGASLCGELAADPLAAPLLVGMGLEELSMSAAAIPEVKAAIARLTVPQAEATLAAALEMDTAADVRHYLRGLATKL